ncbi:MAG: hypothetical protein RIF41_37160 [Polyangiaceae bacterium]
MSDGERGGGQPERARPDRGVRYVLDRERGDDPSDDEVGQGARFRYRGRIEGDDAGWPLEVEVTTGASTPDGLRVNAVVSGAPEETVTAHEKMAAAMVRAAVRRALKEGLRPPRRIQRWRER